MSLHITIHRESTSLGGTQRPNLLVDEETKGSDGCAAYDAGAWVGRKRRNHVSPGSFLQEGSGGLTQPTLHSPLSPSSGRGFQGAWMGLISKLNTQLLQEAFSLMQHPEQAGWGGCAWAQSLYAGQRWIKRAPHKSGQSQPAQWEPPAGPLASPTALPAPNTCACQREEQQLVSPSEDAQNSAQRNTPLPSLPWFPLTSCSKYKRQSPTPFFWWGVGMKQGTTPQRKCIMVSCRWLPFSHLLLRN